MDKKYNFAPVCIAEVELKFTKQASCPVYDTRGGEKSFRMCTREKGPGNVVVSLHTVEVLALAIQG